MDKEQIWDKARDEIIKVLNCCSVQHNCKDCPYSGNARCIERCFENATATIKELTEENEALRADLEDCQLFYEKRSTVALELIKKAQEELNNSMVQIFKRVQKQTAEEIFAEIEEMARVYDEARLKARETLGSMNEGEAMWYSKAFYSADYRKVERGEWEDKRCTRCGEEMWYKERGNALVRIFNRVKSNFCPYCGADMRGE